ncbi:VOC family protein [Nocardia yamanashiensis]|uniref:VOC family protein n=1 Tax=Nocardia yamanashiensis TaxID=209247 RepID=UPI001E5ECD0C|nr:VOC family protein [Nocardia yamanashiensis]UGT44020.1 VOC family protein [Nocardia yamanashiensis]
MQANIAAITLGVADIERSLRFYRDALGLSSKGIIGTEYVGNQEDPGGTAAMFTLDSGLILSLYGRADLAKDASVTLGPTVGAPMSLGYFVDERDEVDRVLDRVGQAGGKLVRAPLERPWGIYAGYFADPDDHLWEVVYFLGERPT